MPGGIIPGGDGGMPADEPIPGGEEDFVPGKPGCEPGGKAEDRSGREFKSGIPEENGRSPEPKGELLPLFASFFLRMPFVTFFKVSLKPDMVSHLRLKCKTSIDTSIYMRYYIKILNNRELQC
jgi:hypothetical protein